MTSRGTEMASPAHSALLPPGSGLALFADALSCPGTDEFLGAHQATTDFFLGGRLFVGTNAHTTLYSN